MATRLGTRERSHKEIKKVKSFQEVSDDIQSNPELKHMKLTVQPKEIEEIEY